MGICRVCESEIQPFMTFGQMPIANGFLTQEQFDTEYFFELQSAYCAKCGMFQLIEQPEPDKMFHGNYAFYSSTSKFMQQHFRTFAESILERFISGRSDPFVVELGSNDGIMLRHFKDAGVRHLGVEPSVNVADVARAQGINTISEFFNEALADQIVHEQGHADAILAANVMCHIPAIHSVAAGAKKLLKPDGVLVFEDPYLGDMVEKTSYDQIYDEHVFIFSAASVSWIFGQHGLELIDVLPQITHGGSMRYIFAPKGAHAVSGNVGRQLEKERAQGLDKAETYNQFRANCESSRDALVALLEDFKAQGKRVVGYGATSKSTTIINYCGLAPRHIEFISDTTPIKQGKFSPGAHIPVKPYESFVSAPPDYALLFAWNHASEIFEKEQGFRKNGGKWIMYIPKVGVIG